MLWNSGGQFFFYSFNNSGQRKMKKISLVQGFLWCQEAIRLGLLLFFNQYWLECQVWSSIRFTAVLSAAFTSDSQIPHTWYILCGTTLTRIKKSSNWISTWGVDAPSLSSIHLKWSNSPPPWSVPVSCVAQHKMGNVLPTQKLINSNPEAHHLNTLL